MTFQQITIESPEKTDAESFGCEIFVLAAIKLFEITSFTQDMPPNSQLRDKLLLSLNRYKVFPFATEFNDLQSKHAKSHRQYITITISFSHRGFRII